jgi:hypothetical protein
VTNHQTARPEARVLHAPAIFDRVIKPAILMPGESLSDYEAIRDMIIQEIAPLSGIEWLWVSDLVELSWDIIRYRTLRQKMLEIRRQDAIAAMLQRIDLPGIPHAQKQFAQDHTELNAEAWRVDPAATTEIEDRLERHGIDQRSINAEVMVQAQELVMLFDGLIQSAQSRRIILLREINRRRLALVIERNGHPRRATTMPPRT